MSHSFNIGYYFEKKMFEPKSNGSVDSGTIKNVANIILEVHFNNNKELQFSDTTECSFKLVTAYPGLITGAGRNHDVGRDDNNFKLGMLFDYTTGMPYISASSIKGTVRAAFDRFKYYDHAIVLSYFKTLFEEIGLNNETLTKESVEKLKDEIFEGKKEGKPLPIYERDLFLDAYICKGDDTHNDGIFSDDYITHHPSPIKNPNPVRFLRIRSNVTFCFRFDFKDSRIEGFEELTTQKKTELIKRIILREGLGAKTNVGYGQLEE